MAFAFKCDICGKYFEEETTVNTRTYTVSPRCLRKSESTNGIKGNVIKIGHISPVDARLGPETLEVYDACPDCIAAIMTMIKALKPSGEEKEPETSTPEKGDDQNAELES